MKLSSFILDRVNPKLLAMSISAVFVGSASAVLRGNLEIFSGTLTLVFAVFLQLSAQLLLVYNGLKGSGNQKIAEADNGFFSMKKILKDLSLTFLLVAATVGISLLSLSNWSTLAIGLTVALFFFVGYMISSPVSQKRLSVILTFLFFGPIGVIGTSLVQSSYETPEVFNMYDIAPSLFFSAICGLYAVCVHFVDNAREYYTDEEMTRSHAKNLLSVKTCKIGFPICAILVLPIAVWGAVYLRIDESWIFYLLTGLSFLFHVFVMVKFFKSKNSVEVGKAENLELLNMLVYSVGMFVLFCVVGVPDDSTYYLF